MGKNVYIVGAGNSTLEAASLCLKNGAKEVSIIYPYSREDLLSRDIDIEKTEHEGVIFLFSTTVSKLMGEEDILTGIEISKPDGERAELPADTLIVATGRLSDLVFVRPNDAQDEDEKPEQESNRWETIASYKMFNDSDNDDVFNLSENSIMNDNLAVVKSIGRGRRITRAVHLFLTGKELEAQIHLIKKGMDILNTEDISNVAEEKRSIMPKMVSVSSYCSNDIFYCPDEIETGFTEEMAKKESLRCLDCGLICYKKSAS